MRFLDFARNDNDIIEINMKKYLYIAWVLVLVVVLGVTGFFVSKKVFIPKEVHHHAGFVVFENNKKLDFSDFKYMSVKPCGLTH